jgi:hypothetical protein
LDYPWQTTVVHHNSAGAAAAPAQQVPTVEA